MNLKHQLFAPEEAFIRLGQTQQTGCLVVVSPEQSSHLFVENGSVVHAYSGSTEGQNVLDEALRQANAFYTWIPDSVPSKKTMSVIIANALKKPAAKKAVVTTTSKVQLDPLTGSVVPAHKEEPPILYLVPSDRPNEKLFILNSTSIVGRDPACDIVLRSNQVSRRHCLFQRNSKGILFRDLDSSNGTKVNGVSLREGLLNHKDILELGTYSLNVYREEKALPPGVS